MAQLFVSGMAHFFVVVSGSKIHERVAHFFIDIYSLDIPNPRFSWKLESAESNTRQTASKMKFPAGPPNR